jgi:D-glycero-alpha-D-manno-heptose-7-phosphate kinase
MMIITRTPFRISFFGGGTDYPAWYLNNGGEVLATTIDKYCYLSCRYLPPFFEHRFRVVYSKIENCRSIDEILHPSVREVLRYLEIDRGVEIHHDGDLPARSGIGSSSAFTVGLLHALYALKGQIVDKNRLARESIHIEQDLLKETVGSQDQVLVAHGGLNQIEFKSNGEISVKPLTLSKSRIQELNNHLMLFYSGIKRTAARVAGSYVNGIETRAKQMEQLRHFVAESISILGSNTDIGVFGRLLHEAWKVKRDLSATVSNSHIDDLYEQAIREGALGGKLLGAGGGGFLLFFVPPPLQQRLRERMNHLLYVPFKFDFHGSQIIFHEDREDYSALDRDRDNRRIMSFRELTIDTDKRGGL